MDLQLILMPEKMAEATGKAILSMLKQSTGLDWKVGKLKAKEDWAAMARVGFSGSNAKLSSSTTQSVYLLGEW